MHPSESPQSVRFSGHAHMLSMQIELRISSAHRLPHVPQFFLSISRFAQYSVMPFSHFDAGGTHVIPPVVVPSVVLSSVVVPSVVSVPELEPDSEPEPSVLVEVGPVGSAVLPESLVGALVVPWSDDDVVPSELDVVVSPPVSGPSSPRVVSCPRVSSVLVSLAESSAVVLLAPSPDPPLLPVSASLELGPLSTMPVISALDSSLVPAPSKPGLSRLHASVSVVVANKEMANTFKSSRAKCIHTIMGARVEGFKRRRSDRLCARPQKWTRCIPTRVSICYIGRTSTHTGRHSERTVEEAVRCAHL